MDQNESTKNVPGQNQSQDGNGHETLEELPGQSNIEQARKCQICGSPNHHACGCEAKARKEKSRLEMSAQEPATTTGKDEELKNVLSAEGIIDQHKAMIEMAADVKAAREFFEGCMSCLGDAVQYLKVIADDVITIRKILRDEYKESEEPNAGENKH